VTKVAQRQFLTKVAGFDGYWATFSGGESSVEITREYDGGSLVPDLLGGQPTISDVTVSRGYDPGRDGPIRSKIARAIAAGQPYLTTITRTPCDEDFTPTGGEPEVYEARVRGVTPSDSDANSATAARIQLVCAIRSAK
jgi:hypothetical protein